MEVLLLREIISVMSAIDPLVDLTEKQTLAYSGGPLLCAEVISRETRGSRSAAHRRGNRDGMDRLMRSLMRGQKLALPLLLALAQYRAVCSYRVKEQAMNPKYLSSVFDEV